MRQVVVTGLGAISPLGLGVSRSWQNLIAGKSGIRSLNGLGDSFSQLQSRVAGLVPQGSKDEGAWKASDWLDRDDSRRMAKFMQYAVVATDEALKDASWHPTTPKQQEMTGVCLGSGIGAFEDVYNTSVIFEKFGPKKVSPLFVPRLLINLAAGHISMKYGFKGPNHAVTTACTTGAHSIGDAARFIAFGDADVMVAGGAESCIHPLAFTGFERLRSLSTACNDQPEKASKPFGTGRDGFVMSEGAGIMVLEELDHALSRRAHIYARVAAYAATADAYHLTQPTGEGAFRAMRRALEVAQLSPSMVDYINAHATSTPLGDRAEAKAISSLMETQHNKLHPQNVCVSSTKGATGHLLGAAGALEAIFTVLALKNNIVPPTLNLTDVDSDIPPFNYVPLTAQKRQIDVALTNSFGFGGTNATLCLTKITT